MGSVIRTSPVWEAPADDWRFGEYRLSLGDRRLWGPDGLVKLGGRAFDLLGLLLQNAGSLVTKDQILACVWEGRIVSEAALTTVVRELRVALSDDRSSPRFIECIYGQGYRFVADVRREAPRVGGLGQTATPDAGGAGSHKAGFPV